MTYKLQSVPSALKEWDKLGSETKSQFKKKLEERIKNPIVPKDYITKNIHKIKLRAAGYRLIYEIDKTTISILVLGVGKRNRNEIYNKVLKDKKYDLASIQLNLISLKEGSKWKLRVEFEGEDIEI